jgi:hypothetical protein
MVSKEEQAALDAAKADEEARAKDQAALLASAEGKDLRDLTTSEVAAVTEAGAIHTYDEALQAGYFGTVTSTVPNEVHLAGSEALRAELYGASANPEPLATDGPFVNRDLASLQGQSLSAPSGTVDAKAAPADTKASAK